MVVPEPTTTGVFHCFYTQRRLLDSKSWTATLAAFQAPCWYAWNRNIFWNHQSAEWMIRTSLLSKLRRSANSMGDEVRTCLSNELSKWFEIRTCRDSWWLLLLIMNSCAQGLFNRQLNQMSWDLITPLIHRVLDTTIRSDSTGTPKLRHVTEILQLADPGPTFSF